MTTCRPFVSFLLLHRPIATATTSWWTLSGGREGLRTGELFDAFLSERDDPFFAWFRRWDHYTVLFNPFSSEIGCEGTIFKESTKTFPTNGSADI